MDEKSVVQVAIATIGEIYVYNSSYMIPSIRLYNEALIRIMDNYRELHKWKKIDYRSCAYDMKRYLAPYTKNREYVQIERNSKLHDAYSEFHRPLSARQVICMEQFAELLSRGKKEDAFFELYECINDYGRASMRKIISLNEYSAYTLMISMLI